MRLLGKIGRPVNGVLEISVLAHPCTINQLPERRFPRFYFMGNEWSLDPLVPHVNTRWLFPGEHASELSLCSLTLNPP